jgi:hypothetical protein
MTHRARHWPAASNSANIRHVLMLDPPMSASFSSMRASDAFYDQNSFLGESELFVRHILHY